MFKKQEKRQGKDLIDIVNNRSNLNRCGECGSEHPTWASWTLGIFLCGRCANIHKNVLSVNGPNGRPISKVKSLTLDKWSDDQIDNLRRIGNRKARNKWNLKRVPFPHDDDDDGPIEEYFREKYILGLYRDESADLADYDDVRSGASSPSTPRGRRSRSSTVNSYRLRNNSMQLIPRPTSSQLLLPRLSHRKLTSYERSLYSIQASQLYNMGYHDRDATLESLLLANGDMQYALEILAHDAKVNPTQAELPPDLPRRPRAVSTAPSYGSSSNGLSAASATRPAVSRAQSSAALAPTEWWNNLQPVSAQQTQQPQLQATLQPQIYQYTDPVSGQVSYVDSNGNQYLDPNNPQHQLLLMQQTGIQQPAQNTSAKQSILSLYNQPTGFQQQQQPQLTRFPQQQQLQQQQQQQPQMTGFQQQQQPQFTGFSQMNTMGMQPTQTGQFIQQPQYGYQPQQQTGYSQPQQNGFMMAQPQQFPQGQFFG